MAKVRLQSRERRKRKALERLKLGNRALEGQPVKIRTMFSGDLWPQGKPSKDWAFNSAHNKSMRLSDNAKRRERAPDGRFKPKSGMEIDPKTGELIETNR